MEELKFGTIGSISRIRLNLNPISGASIYKNGVTLCIPIFYTMLFSKMTLILILETKFTRKN